MKILIFGYKGYLGQYFLKAYPDALTSDADIADALRVAQELDKIKPDIVINCAGKTGRPNIDWCEDHKTETIHSNVMGPLVLMEEAQKRSIRLVHLGSGCIYYGDNNGRGYSEEDTPNFTGSFYSRTKIWSDQILKEFPVLLIRLRMPFDGSKSERNLISKITKYEKVLDVQNSMTYLPEMVAAVQKLIDKKATGIYHVVNPGTISPYKIVEMYRDLVDNSHQFEKIDNDQLLKITSAARSNCVLNSDRLEKEGIEMTPVKEVIKKSLLMLKN